VQGDGETEATCRDIVKLDEHPKVKAALLRLRSLATVDSEQLERDVTAWVASARSVYTLDCVGMKELWQAYCGEDWETSSDNATPKSRAQAQAEVIRARMIQSIDPLLARLPALEARVQILLAKKETRRKGNELNAELVKQRPRLQRLANNESWKGNYNLLTQYANTYGRDRHKSLWGSFGCNVPISDEKEAEFPGSEEHRKPDCIIANKCEVWEFKADSPGGHREGNEQRDSYGIVVPRYYTERYTRKEPAAPLLGGSAIMETLQQHCLRGDAIRIDAKLHFYKMCDSQYECISSD
jgi:hypothetical protein